MRADVIGMTYGSRDYENLSSDTLALWLRMLGGEPPGTLSVKDAVPLELAPPEIARKATCGLCGERAVFHDAQARGMDKNSWRCETCFIPIALQQDDV